MDKVLEGKRGQPNLVDSSEVTFLFLASLPKFYHVSLMLGVYFYFCSKSPKKPSVDVFSFLWFCYRSYHWVVLIKVGTFAG